MTLLGDWLLALSFARRELRGGLKGFRVFLACLALGVAAIAGVGTLTKSIVAGLKDDGRKILGGDIDLRLSQQKIAPEALAWLRQRGRLSRTLDMRTIAHGALRRTLVELKAVDEAYPLYGAVRLRGGGDLGAALAQRDGRFGAVLESQVLYRLALEPGGEIRIGEQVYQVRGVIEHEPDRAASQFVLGPRALVARASMAGTGLVKVGSLIHYHTRLKLPEGTDVGPVVNQLRAAFPDAAWRIRTHRNGAPGLRLFLDRLRLFLTLVGLTALLVGGVGVGNAVRSYIDGKTATIATLKCLGATSGAVVRIYLAQVMILATLGIAGGLAIGIATPFVLGSLLAEVLPVALKPGLYPGPLILATAYGGLIALAFALWPLGLAGKVPAGGLFRSAIAPATGRPRPIYVLAVAAALAVLCLLAILTTEERAFAAWFIVGAAGCFAVLSAAGLLIQALARRARRPRDAGLRLALANIHRPGAPTGSVVLSLGLGLTLLVTVVLIEGNFARQVKERLPEQAPAFFFVDIQKDQIDRFLALAHGIPGVERVRNVPSLRGRITRVNGIPAREVEVAPEERWVLSGDRGLTYAARPPGNNPVVAGTWWPADYDGPPLVSLEATAARGLGLDIGDTITVNVLGREITATVRNLRQVDWGSLGINFVLVFDPNTLKPAPHTYIATADTTPEAEEVLYRAVTDTFANVTAVRMKEALELVNDILIKIGAAVRGVALVTLVAGVLVLAGAMAAGQSRRVYDAVIFKVLGATRRDILRAFVVEYAILGLATAVVAGAAGALASYMVMTRVMGADWQFVPGVAVATLGLGLVATVGFGLAGTWRALAQKPAPVLRTE